MRKTLRGNAALVAAPGVIKLIMVQCLRAAYLAAAGSLLIPYAAQRAFSPTETGLLLAATSVGMLIGDVIVGRAFGPATRERLVLPFLLVMGTPSIALMVELPYLVVAAVYAITGVGSAYLLGLQRRFLKAVPTDLQGRGFALLNTATMTVQGIGPLVFGVFAEFIPVGSAWPISTAARHLGSVWPIRGRSVWPIRGRSAWRFPVRSHSPVPDSARRFPSPSRRRRARPCVWVAV